MLPIRMKSWSNDLQHQAFHNLLSLHHPQTLTLSRFVSGFRRFPSIPAAAACKADRRPVHHTSLVYPSFHWLAMQQTALSRRKSTVSQTPTNPDWNTTHQQISCCFDSLYVCACVYTSVSVCLHKQHTDGVLKRQLHSHHYCAPCVCVSESVCAC